MASASEGIVVNEEDVQLVREWLRKKPHIPQDIDDYFIRSMIAVRKGSVQRAKMLLENFFYFTCHMLPYLSPDGEVFTKTSARFDQLCYVCTLPRRTPEGYKVIVSRLEKKNHNVDDYHEADYYFRRALQNYMVPLFERDYDSGEFVYVADYSGFTLDHFKTSNIQFMDIMMKCLGKNAYPMRLKAFHFLSIPKIIDWLVLKPFQLLSEKMRKRIVVHHDLASLHRSIPADILPEEFGGNSGSIKDHNANFNELLRKHEVSMKKLWRTILEIKDQLPKVEDEAADTFRKLEID